jgi:dihydropteroate synthase
MEAFGPLIINDISGGCEAMYSLVRSYAAPYIWTLRGDLELPAHAKYMEGIQLILDPGFGFIGSPERDYECMRSMDTLRRYDLPILVGVSRKSMVYKPLDLTPETCPEATQALQLYALFHGATILRTHDVAHTARTIKLYNILNSK